MYQISDYARMAGDRHRLRAYFRALEQTVRPGEVVLDLGTGTGLFAMHAAKLGARKVYAIDSNPVVQLARRIARDNGLAEKIEFLQEDSLEASLPETVDVIVSDLRGVLPLHFTHLPAIIDAHSRWLKPGGKLIPLRDSMYAALVSAEEVYATYADCWRGLPFDLETAERIRLNTWGRARIEPDAMISVPQRWCVLDYSTVNLPDTCGELHWTIERTAIAHGMAVWYVAELAEGTGFSTAPGEPETVSGTAFFPFLQPVPLRAGDAVHVILHAKLAGREYVWAWKTQVTASEGKIKASFEQCSLAGELLQLAGVKK